mgnify:CR=1 FL=1
MVKVRIITEKGYETNGQACGEIEIKSPFLCSEVCPYRAPEQKTGIILPEI